MTYISIVVFLFAIIDLMILPFLSFKLRQKGLYQIFLPTFYKSASLILLIILGFYIGRNFNHISILSLFIYVNLVTYVFMQTFEIYEYLLRDFNAGDVDVSNLSDEGKQFIQMIIKDMQGNPTKAIEDRIWSMGFNYWTNIYQDYMYGVALITNNIGSLAAFECFNEELGVDKNFAKYGFIQLVDYSRVRIIIDFSIILLVYTIL